MPRLSTVVIRLALVQLLLGFSAGAWLLAVRGIPSLPAPAWLRPVHLELALLGWTLQLAMGVAYWILPRYPTQPERGALAPVVLAFILLNLGVILAIASSASGSGPVLLIGRFAELAAVILFAAHAWPRVKAFGQ